MTDYRHIILGELSAKSSPSATTGSLKQFTFFDPMSGLLEPPPPPPDPDILYIPKNGGYQLTISGVILAGTYIVHIGLGGTADDAIAYPGNPGEGNEVEFVDQGGGISSAIVYTPPLATGANYLIFLEGVGTADVLLDDPIVTVLPKVFRSSAFSLKQMLPPHHKTGARHPGNVEYPQ